MTETTPLVSKAKNLLQASAKLETDAEGFAVPRPLPRGARIDNQEEGKLSVSLPAVRKWWIWTPPALFASLAFFFMPIGIAFGVSAPRYANSGAFIEGGFNPLPAVFVFLLICFVTWLLAKWVFPRLVFAITKDGITVNDVKYRPNLTSGLRVGYQVEGSDTLSGQAEVSKEGRGVGFKTLRYAYGSWGEDLPFAVNAYHAAEYVVWVNMMIKGFYAPPAKQNDPSKGRKSADF